MERPVSRMLAIPSQVAELNDLQRLCRRLEQAKGFQLKAAHLGDAFCSLELSSQGQAYTLSLYLTPFGIPPLYRCQHYFPDVDAEELEAREQGFPAAGWPWPPLPTSRRRPATSTRSRPSAATGATASGCTPTA